MLSIWFLDYKLNSVLSLNQVIKSESYINETYYPRSMQNNFPWVMSQYSVLSLYLGSKWERNMEHAAMVL